MKVKSISSISLMVLLFMAVILPFSCKKAEKTTKTTVPAAEVKPWPTSIPCRIKDGENRDLFIMTLGDIKTGLADGIFDPGQDRVILSGGSEIPDYYKERLKVTYFRPVDKYNFPLPPSGWCSWYYYYHEVSEGEIKKNAFWLAENLKDFGTSYCQIDDGWQGRGHGSGDNRDWTTIDKRFPSGMAALAAYIKSLGLKPGLWLAPHGQSSADVVSRAQTFLFMPDGSSASKTWEGDYLLDPTKPEAVTYLTNLFKTLAETWGYDYFKIDGQPLVIGEYKAKKEFMQNPDANPEEAYRRTLLTIRDAIGPSRYLLGCWGIPLEGVGIMNGSRTGGDVLIPWEGFEVALQATMKYYFLHNIAWYCDPDVMFVRQPLTLDMARAWATLQGLTGQSLMTSDRLYDLPAERVEIMKRVFPAVDIRPLDLFPSDHFKRIWDLKVHHLGRDYDVVGCFNFDQDKASGVDLLWRDLGLPNGILVHVYDFWNKEYLGSWEKGFYVPIAPASCRVLALEVAKDVPQLISTSRHITQGWLDLKELNYNEQQIALEGKSSVIKNDSYELRVAFPRKGTHYRIKEAKAEGQEVTIRNYQGWAAVSFIPKSSEEVSWRIFFEPADVYRYPVNSPRNIQVEIKGLDKVLFRWSPLYDLSVGYMVYVNDEPYIYTPINLCEISGLMPGVNMAVSVFGVWNDGTLSKNPATTNVQIDKLVAGEIYLSELAPTSISSGWGIPRMDKAVSGYPLQIGNRTYKRGIGTHAVSDISYPVGGMFKTFEAEVGVDAQSSEDRGSIEFVVFGDGNIIWKSGSIKKGDAPKRVRADIAKIKVLQLHVGDAGDGIEADHADWADARLIK